MLLRVLYYVYSHVMWSMSECLVCLPEQGFLIRFVGNLHRRARGLRASTGSYDSTLTNGTCRKNFNVNRGKKKKKGGRPSPPPEKKEGQNLGKKKKKDK